MILKVLTENTASGIFLAEFGLSYYIEHDNQKIIFDTGHSDVFLRNAKKLNVNIDDCDFVVLSHGHWDHGDGLKFMRNKRLVCHPEAFKNRYSNNGMYKIGLNLGYNEIASRYDLILSKEPYYITNKIIYLGEIPRKNSYESKVTSYVDELGNKDYVPDDSALVLIHNDSIVVVAGCSHSGICNIMDYAKEITGMKKIKAVIGGFHLKLIDQQMERTIEYFREEKVDCILPGHCTQLPVLSQFYNEFKIDHIKSGMIFEF